MPGNFCSYTGEKSKIGQWEFCVRDERSLVRTIHSDENI